MKKVYIYKIFERFWHWGQAALIFFLILTGFEVHGNFDLFGYEEAVRMHNTAGWAFLVLIVFAIFWHLTTGEWKQYIPTTKYLKEQFNYYIGGIFQGAPHPTKKLVYNKFNPLQRFIYLGLKILVIPVQVISGFLYLYFNYPVAGIELGGLDVVAFVHTLGAFMLMAFIIAHIYLTTTGHRPLSSIKAMITGWEEMSEEDAKSAIVDDMKVKLEKTRSILRAGEDKSEFLDAALDEAEEEVGKIDTHFRDKVSKTGAGYFCISPEGIYKNVNEAWIALYKYSAPDEILGKHYSLSRTEEDFIELEKSFKRVLDGETIPHGEVQRYCKDGTLGYHTLTMTPLIKGNKVVGVEGFIIDTTDRRLAEKELLDKQIRLEKNLDQPK